MNAVGWCKNCGDVGVWALCADAFGWEGVPYADHRPNADCCQYADCSFCGEDVDQWKLVS